MTSITGLDPQYESLHRHDLRSENNMTLSVEREIGAVACPASIEIIRPEWRLNVYSRRSFEEISHVSTRDVVSALVSIS